MGTFTDNLLKLTEFPFSYSLIGLLAFIIYRHSLLGLDIEQLAPLLILMGFVATTLSITDPIGALLKESLYGFRNRARVETDDDGESFVLTPRLKDRYGSYPPSSRETPPSEEKLKTQEYYRSDLVDELGLLDILGTLLFRVVWKSIIKNTVLACLSPNFRDIFSRRIFFVDENSLSEFLMGLDLKDISQIFVKIVSLKEASLRTPWMQREIDKITSMVYFLIVVFVLVSILIVDLVFQEPFLDKFVAGIQGTALSEEGVCTPTGACNPAKITILGISLAFFGAVFYKFYRRRRELQAKAFTAFKFLLERDAIQIEAAKKEEKDTFHENLHEIEQYLNNGDWTLAESSCQRVMKDYDEFNKRERLLVRKEGETPADKGKNVKYENGQGAGIY
jgi:hypothetical protein